MEQAVANLSQNAEETVKCCSQILHYGEQTQQEWYLGFAHYYSGEAYYTLNNVERVLYHISYALGYLEHTGEWELVARAYNLIAITSVMMGKPAFAMDYYIQALSCCRKHALPIFGNTVLINIGSLYYMYGEYERASTYFIDSLHSLDLNPQMDDYYLCVAVDYIGLGRCALHQGDIDQAKYYAQQIEKICKPHMDISNYIYLSFIAEIYHDTGNIEARDNCISDIQSNLNEQIRIMDYFDDFYEYASLLLRIDYHEHFLYLIELLDKLASQAQVANLRRRIRELKIKYYKKIGDTQAYFRKRHNSMKIWCVWSAPIRRWYWR